MHGELSTGSRRPWRTQHGIAIVHQHPAVLPDMTVAENIRVAVPARFLTVPRRTSEAMRLMLADVGSTAHLEDRVDSLTVAQKHLLELAKALVLKPSLLILDEPTAPLGRRPSSCSSTGCGALPPAGPPSSTSRTAWPRCGCSPRG